MKRHGGDGFWVRVVTYIYKYLDGTTRCGIWGHTVKRLGSWRFLIFLCLFFFGVTYTEPHKVFRMRGDTVYLYLASQLTVVTDKHYNTALGWR